MEQSSFQQEVKILSWNEQKKNKQAQYGTVDFELWISGNEWQWP